MNPPRPGSRLVPTELAALAAGVSQATIRKWASRGKLTRYGTPGRAQYDLDELMELLAGATNSEPAGE
jgi:phage terminase Nu1 subunit (DNA packaging protein)